MAQQTLQENETVTHELTDGTRLIETADGGGAVVERYGEPDDHDGVQHWRIDYDDYNDARLHLGLWIRVDGFDRPDRSCDQFMPIEVAAAGRETLAAWLMTFGGQGSPGSRKRAADRLDVTVDTVSRYCSRVRSEVPKRQAATEEDSD